MRRNGATTVTELRRYAVLNVKQAKEIAREWLKDKQLDNAVEFGLPEVDDRYHVWRVPLLSRHTDTKVGEIVIDAKTSFVIEDKSTRPDAIESRILGRESAHHTTHRNNNHEKYEVSTLRNTIILGDSERALLELPAGSVGLIFTSPPYYNARPEYTDYLSYEEYLLKLKKIIQNSHHVLSEGRFFVMNISPVLVRRANRNEASKRIAVPFDVHPLFVNEGFDFIDDIIWEKPEGAGWATGRGRRFAADRNPLQYKTVPVTEYILVYRKRTEKLIDWNIRAHPEPGLVKESKIGEGYETTNIWRIKPAYDKRHPAIFPPELAEKVVSYYSFKNDVVLDPFAGIGTTAIAAIKLKRRFVMIEENPEYVGYMKDDIKKCLGKAAKSVLTKNTDNIDISDVLI
ncbi:MAG: site-specific DNA-methyltransferase [Planctomycetota bacterium]